jgi:hypothetical protein
VKIKHVLALASCLSLTAVVGACQLTPAQYALAQQIDTTICNSAQNVVLASVPIGTACSVIAAIINSILASRVVTSVATSSPVVNAALTYTGKYLPKSVKVASITADQATIDYVQSKLPAAIDAYFEAHPELLRK